MVTFFHLKPEAVLYLHGRFHYSDPSPLAQDYLKYQDSLNGKTVLDAIQIILLNHYITKERTKPKCKGFKPISAEQFAVCYEESGHQTTTLIISRFLVDI